MNQENKVFNRRLFFKWGLGTAGTLAGSSAVAKACGLNTGAQDLGPFFPSANTPLDPIKENPDESVPISLSNDNDLTFVQGRQGHATGQYVVVKGILTNEACEPIEGATIIIWQASASGRYNHKGDGANTDFKDPRDGTVIKRTLDPYFQSWGQTITNAKGEYEFKTIVPGFYPANLQSGWYRPPHIHFMISATGYPQLVTQMYFRSPLIEDNDFIQELNRADTLLQGKNLSEAQREELIVDFKASDDHLLIGDFDIVLKD